MDSRRRSRVDQDNARTHRHLISRSDRKPLNRSVRSGMHRPGRATMQPAAQHPVVAARRSRARAEDCLGCGGGYRGNISLRGAGLGGVCCREPRHVPWVRPVAVMTLAVAQAASPASLGHRTPLQLLLIEDSSPDSELVLALLEDELPEVEVHVADSLNDGLARPSHAATTRCWQICPCPTPRERRSCQASGRHCPTRRSSCSPAGSTVSSRCGRWPRVPRTT